jgi:hypothetical protein
MGDQAERVILEAEDQVSPVVDKANAGLDSFEKKAESSHGAADDQASVIMEKSWKEFQQYDEKRSAEQRQKAMSMFLPSKEQVKEWEDEFKARDRIEDIAVEAQREVLRRESTRQAKAAETPEEGYQVPADWEQLRLHRQQHAGPSDGGVSRQLGAEHGPHAV